MLTEKEIQILLLRQKGLLQSEIASKLKITQSAVSRFEANARKKIQEALTHLEVLDKLGIQYDKSTLGSEELAKLYGGGK